MTDKPTFRPSPTAFLVALILWAVVAWAVFVATSCAGAPRFVEPDPFAPMHEDPWVEPEPVTVAPAALIDDAVVEPNVRRFTGRTACMTSGNVLPWVFTNGGTTPRVDEWFGLYGTRGTTPIYEVGDEMVAAWIIGLSKLDPPLAHPDAPGCWLLVKPDVNILCWQRDTFWASPDDRFRTRIENSHVILRIRPHPALAGHSIYVQLVMAAPGENRMGVLGSQGIELRVSP